MAKIESFSSGILSPALDASTEVEKHRYGLKECTNMIVDQLGGVKNRPGTEHVCAALGGKLVPFQFNVEQGYMLEVGTTTTAMQVIKDGSQVLTDLVDTSVYKWTESVAQAGEYHLELAAGGDPGILSIQYLLEDGSKMTEGSLGSLAEGEWKYGNNDTLGYNTPYVRIVGTTDPDGESTGYIQAPVMVASPLTSITDLNYTQSADTLYLVNGVDAPHKLTRRSHVDWDFTEIAFEDGPYKARVPLVDSKVSINAKFISGVIWEFKASSAIFGDVGLGEPVRLGFPVQGDSSTIYWSWFIVSTLTSDTVIRAEVQGDQTVVKEQITNPKFKDGLTFWEDTTPVRTVAKLTYDSATYTAVLTEDGVAGEARMEQLISTFANRGHKLKIVVTLTGTPPNIINVHIGTTSGGTEDDPATPIVITSSGTYEFDIIPSTNLIYLSLNTNGSTNGVVAKFSLISVTTTDTLVAGATEHNTNDWRLAAWNATYGYPSVVEFDPMSDRLVFGATPSEPQSLWMSKVGDYENMGFSTPIISSDSFGITLNARQLNGIEWMLPIDSLAIGTKGSLWRLTGGANYAPMTPTSISARQQSKTQNSSVYPEIIGKSIILIERNQTSIKEMTYSLDADGYGDRDLTFLAGHLFKGLYNPNPSDPGGQLNSIKLIDMAYAETPDSILWCVQNDGTLLGMTYDKSIDIWAWHKHTTPGWGGTTFSQVSVIPGEYSPFIDTQDDVYFTVARFNLNAPPPFREYHIERLGRRITNAARYDYLFLDDSSTYDDFSTPITVVTGLERFNGITVTVLADGVVIKGKTVSNGQITLDTAASLIHVGLPYTSEIETLDIETMFRDTGSTQGMLKSVTSVTAYFKDTRGAEVADSDVNTYFSIPFDDEKYGEGPPDLYNGSKEVVIKSVPTKEKRVKIRQTEPLPIHIKRLIFDVKYTG
jgi:hypothetical protein